LCKCRIRCRSIPIRRQYYDDYSKVVLSPSVLHSSSRLLIKLSEKTTESLLEATFVRIKSPLDPSPSSLPITQMLFPNWSPSKLTLIGLNLKINQIYLGHRSAPDGNELEILNCFMSSFQYAVPLDPISPTDL
ncbi:hypothetical protein BLOT_005570, partial [Blomia tropicalis]